MRILLIVLLYSAITNAGLADLGGLLGGPGKDTFTTGSLNVLGALLGAKPPPRPTNAPPASTTTTKIPSLGEGLKLPPLPAIENLTRSVDVVTKLNIAPVTSQTLPVKDVLKTSLLDDVQNALPTGDGATAVGGDVTGFLQLNDIGILSGLLAKITTDAIGKLLQVIIPPLVDFINTLVSNAKPFFNQLAPIIKTLKPFFPWLVQAYSQLLPYFVQADPGTAKMQFALP